MKKELKCHTIILPSYCPVAICITKASAEELAKARGYKNYRVELTTKRDLKCMMEGHFE